MNNPSIGVIARSARAGRHACAAEPTAVQRRRHAQLVSLFLIQCVVQIAPAIKELLQRHFAALSFVESPVWLHWVLLAAILEFAMALSVIRVIDHAATWILSLLSLGVAMGYAWLLALVMFARQGSLLTSLGLADSARGNALPLTCLALLTSHAVTAWILGRTAVSQKAEFERRIIGS